MINHKNKSIVRFSAWFCGSINISFCSLTGCLVEMLETEWPLISKFVNYINTNEIPGELSRENMISSHGDLFTGEKITVPTVT